MDNHIAVIHHDPTLAGVALFFAFFAMRCAHGFQRRIRQRVQHAVAGAGTQDEVIGKGCNFLNIKQKNIFAFFVLQRIDNGMGQVECVQISPHCLHGIAGKVTAQLAQYAAGDAFGKQSPADTMDCVKVI